MRKKKKEAIGGIVEVGERDRSLSVYSMGIKWGDFTFGQIFPPFYQGRSLCIHTDGGYGTSSLMEW